MSLVRRAGSKLVVDNRRQRVIATALLSAGMFVVAAFLSATGGTSIVAWFLAAAFGALAVRDAFFNAAPVLDTEQRTLRGPVFAFFGQIGAVVLYRRGARAGEEEGIWTLGVVMPGPAAMASMSRQLEFLEQSTSPYRDSGEKPAALEVPAEQVEVHDVLTHLDLPELQDAAIRVAKVVGVPVLDLSPMPQRVRPEISGHTFSFDVEALRRDVMGVRKQLSEKDAP